MRSEARRWGLLLALAVLVADQASKYWVLHVIDLPRRVSVAVLPVLNLTLTMNEGVSMGLLRAGSDTGRWLLVVLTGAIALLVGWWMVRETALRRALALALILGGALGNILDRVRYGAVVDFIEVKAVGGAADWLRQHLGTASFYVFNVADAAITLGVLLLLLFTLQDEGAEGSRDGKGE